MEKARGAVDVTMACGGDGVGVFAIFVDVVLDVFPSCFFGGRLRVCSFR